MCRSGSGPPRPPPDGRFREGPWRESAHDGGGRLPPEPSREVERNAREGFPTGPSCESGRPAGRRRRAGARCPRGRGGVRRSPARRARRPGVRRGERHPDDRARGAPGRREPDGGGDRPAHRIDAPGRRGGHRRRRRGGRGRGHVPHAGAGRDARASARSAHGAVRRAEPALSLLRQRRDHRAGHAGRAVAARTAGPHRSRPVPGAAPLRRQPVDERGARHPPPRRASSSCASTTSSATTS